MGILPLLLPPRLQVQLHGSLPFGSPQSWSQVVDQSPGYGATASSGGTTSPSTTAAGMSGYVSPPPGLTLVDFSNWRLLPPEAPASRGLPTAPPGLPGVGRSIRLRGTAERTLGHRWCSVQAAWPNGLPHRPHRCSVRPKWCRLSANHYQSGLPCRTTAKEAHGEGSHF